MPTTLCGYELADVRKSLRGAIAQRQIRPTHRWAAELVATPGAIGSLWSTLWLEACIPTLPILLKQSWADVVAHIHATDGDWVAFRNSSDVRALVTEMTTRILKSPRQAIPSWPAKDVTLYDVGVLKDGALSANSDSPIVMGVWNRDVDAVELRQMAGFWLDAIQKGDMRIVFSITQWTLTTPLKCGLRMPTTEGLTAKQRASPIWFWFALGSAFLRSKDVHRGWFTLHDATVEAMILHFKRWSMVERHRIFLLWIQHLRSALQVQDPNLWQIEAIQQAAADIDLPYKEVSADFAGQAVPAVKVMTSAERSAEKLRLADIQLNALLGLN